MLEKLLSLDVGDKRVGIAISESGILANELTTIKNDQTAFLFIKDLIIQRKIDKLIVGLPVLKSGSLSKQAIKTKLFIRQLLYEISIPVVYENEYLTTKEAQRILKNLNLNSDQIALRLDQMSAKLILEQYINEIS